MDINRVRTFLGFAMRKGSCSAGDFTAEKLIKTGKAKLLILDEEASDATKERYKGFAERANIGLLQLKNMGEAIGKPGRKIAVVTDAEFSKLILSAAKAQTDNISGVE